MAAEGYGEDLAYIHDVGFGDFARRSARGVLDWLGRYHVTRGTVLDLGCGTGIWARVLVDDGYQVIGVDLSEGMLRIARCRVPEARFIQGSFYDVDLPDCGAVTCLGECLNYTFDPKADLERMAALFHRIHDALDPGGIFVFDLLEPAYLEHADLGPREFRGEDWATTVRIEPGPRGDSAVRHITSCRLTPTGPRVTTEAHPLLLYDRGDVVDALGRAGFTAEVLNAYGDFALGAGHVGFVAHRI